MILFKKTILLAALSFLILSATTHAQIDTNLESTALRTLVIENPMLDYASADASNAINGRKNEIQSVFNAVLTEAGKKLFFQPLPFVKGRVLLDFSEPVKAKINARFGQNNILNLTRSTTGLTKFDAITTRYRGLTLEKMGSIGFILQFPANVNPNLVVAELSTLSEIDYAEVDAVFGGVTVLERQSDSGGNTALYILSLGWGDCSAGCSIYHHVSVEVDLTAQVPPKKVAETGEPVDVNAYPTKIFK